MRTITSGDEEFIPFSLKQIDPITGEESAYPLTNASSITFIMRRYGSNSIELKSTCSILDGSLGTCYTKIIVPSVESNSMNRFQAEIKVYDTSGKVKTWYKDLEFVIRPSIEKS